MAKLLYFCVAILCFQFTLGRVVRDTEKQPFDIQDAIKQVETALGELKPKFHEIVGVKNDEELSQLIETRGKEFADKIKAGVEQINAEASKVDQSAQAIGAKLLGVVDEFKTHLDTSPDAKTRREEFEKRVQTILAESKDFGTKLQAQGENIGADAKKALEEVLAFTSEAVKKVSHDIETIIQQNKN